MEVPIFDNDKWKDIDIEMLLKVPTSKGEQIFRIKEIVKGINSIKVYGKHVFFDLENNFILDTNIVQKDGRGAINQILGAMANNMVNTYYGDSDISIVNNSRLVRKNVVSALIGDADNSFINRWGGELEVDNFNFSIKQRIGEDRDFQIRYRKNLTGFEGNTNTYNLCTRIIPVGFDGIMLEGTKYVDSQYINNYPQIYTYEIKFDDIKVKENADDEEGYNTIEEARVALRQAAEDYFINSKCDLPTFSANVNFETLKYTEEYKDLNILERVELGDDVNVYIDKIDININARVVKTKYNFFTQKYTEIEIGDVKPNLFKQIANLKNAIDLVTEQLGGNSWQDILDKALDEATKLMQEGLKDSYVITMKNQIVIGDNPDINNMINCIVINKNGIGFSNNGYLPDRLISAMTIDGKINASCISVGELNAALIKTGLLSSRNGSTWINMEDGTFKFGEKLIYDGQKLLNKADNGNNAIKIERAEIDFYDFNRDIPMAKLYTSYMLNYLAAGFAIGHEKESYFSISYKAADGYYYPYILFDKYNINPEYTSPIRIVEGTVFSGVVNLQNRVYMPNTIVFDSQLSGTSPQMFKNTNDSRNILCVQVAVNNANDGYMVQTNTGGVLFSILAGRTYPILLNNNTQVSGNFTVTGSKNSLQETKNYGERLINAYETAEYFFGDVGSGIIKDGECIIWIDEILKECINTNIEYHIFTQAYNGAINKIERYKDYFIVFGENKTEFSWELKAKRKGYENVRLDKPNIEGLIDNTPNFTEEDFQSITTENMLIREIEFDLENILMEVQ